MKGSQRKQVYQKEKGPSSPKMNKHKKRSWKKETEVVGEISYRKHH